MLVKITIESKSYKPLKKMNDKSRREQNLDNERGYRELTSLALDRTSPNKFPIHVLTVGS